MICEETCRKVVEDLAAAAGAPTAADMRRVNEQRDAAIVAAQAAGRRWDRLPKAVPIPQALLDAETKAANKAAREAEAIRTALEGAARARGPEAPRMALLLDGRWEDDDLVDVADIARRARARW